MTYYENRRAGNPYFYRKLEKYLAFFAGSRRLLELGCGQGDFLELCGRQGIRAEGVDLDAEAVKGCRARGLNVREQDATRALKTLKGRTDAVFCSNVLEHLDPADLEALLDAAAAALQRGGKFAASTANPKSLGVLAGPFWEDATHRRLYPPALLRQLLEARGFEVLISGEDEDTRSQAWYRVAIRAIRRLLVGPFFGPPETALMAVKR